VERGGTPTSNFTALQPPSAAAAASGAFSILEYCDKEMVIIREQYYIDLLQPEYNILQLAGSSLGYKHTPESATHFLIFIGSASVPP